MKSQWECVLENIGKWVGSFTTVTPQGELIEDIPSIISLEGVRDNQAIHLVLKRFYPLPNSTETYAKEVVWDFSTPPGIGAVYFETGAFSSGGLIATSGAKFIVEFSLVGIDRRFRTIQQYSPEHQLDRVTYVREHRQDSNAPERPHLTVPDLCGTWTGTAITRYPDDRSPLTNPIKSTFGVGDRGYQWSEGSDSIKLKVISDRLLQFERNTQSYQLLLLPDSSYSLTPTQIGSGQPFSIEIGWIHQPGQRQRLVRRYDSTGTWHSATFITESQQFQIQKF
jgi:Domain of unknown function (DUF3598)